jgi:hypothetical protein
MSEVRYRLRILGPTGTFAWNDAPWTLVHLKADPNTSSLLQRYRYKAWTEDGTKLDQIPEFPQPVRAWS